MERREYKLMSDIIWVKESTNWNVSVAFYFNISKSMFIWNMDRIRKLLKTVSQHPALAGG